MHGKPTSFDIAYLAGVSQPTVSRALRGSPVVSLETRKRIEAIAQQLHYKVDKNASNLRFQRSNTLALLLFEDPTPDDSLINPFFLAMMGSITRACSSHGYDLLISFQNLSGDWHKDYEDSHKADGIILLGYGDYLQHQAKLEQLVAQHTHFVRWGMVAAGQPGLSVGCDNFRGGQDAAAHLISLGRRHVAFLGDGSDHYPEFRERHRGYLQALEIASLQAEPHVQIDAISTEQSGYEAAMQLLVSGMEFDAIVAASDLIAIGALRALQEHHISVPETVSVIGFDDIPAASFTNPQLTTVMQDTQRAGEILVETAVRLACGEPAESTVLPAKLVVRRSCGAAQISKLQG
jgi:DNA-binding LacI/PurR family transcriptional regulator